MIVVGDPLSRVSAIRNANPSGTVYASYEYNREGRLAQVDYPEIDVRLDYLQGTSGTYKGFDRFGRVVDQYWDGYGMTADVDRIKHGYDEAGSRTYRDIELPSYTANAKDQVYAYDGLDRLQHRSTVIYITGESDRLREEKRANKSKDADLQISQENRKQTFTKRVNSQ